MVSAESCRGEFGDRGINCSDYRHWHLVLLRDIGFTRSSCHAKARLAQAEFQQHRAEGVNAYLSEEVLGLADPNRSGKAGISLLEAMDLAAGRIDQRFPNDPEMRTVIRDHLGEVFRQVDEPAKAVEQLRMAVELRIALDGELNPKTLQCRSKLGYALFTAGRRSEAKEVLLSTIADQTKVLGKGHPDTIGTEVHLDVLLRAVNDENAFKHAEQTFEIARQALGPRHPRTLEAQSDYAWGLRYAGQLEKALENAKEATVGLREIIGDDQTRTMFASYNYAVMHAGTSPVQRSRRRTARGY